MKEYEVVERAFFAGNMKIVAGTSAGHQFGNHLKKIELVGFIVYNQCEEEVQTALHVIWSCLAFLTFKRRKLAVNEESVRSLSLVSILKFTTANACSKKKTV